MCLWGGEDLIFGSSVNFAPLKVSRKCNFENLKQDLKKLKISSTRHKKEISEEKLNCQVVKMDPTQKLSALIGSTCSYHVTEYKLA